MDDNIYNPDGRPRERASIGLNGAAKTDRCAGRATEEAADNVPVVPSDLLLVSAARSMKAPASCSAEKVGAEAATSISPEQACEPPPGALELLAQRPYISFELEAPDGVPRTVMVDEEAYEALGCPDVFVDSRFYPSFWEGRRKWWLHVAVYDFLAERGLVAPLPDGWIVHHRTRGRAGKCDCRAHRLFARSRRGHAIDHSILRRCGKPGKAGTWRPHRPGPIRTIAKSLAPPRPRPARSAPPCELTKTELDVELALAARLPELRAAVRPLEKRKRRIPRVGDLRGMRVHRDRLGTLPGECAVICAMVHYKFDRDVVLAELHLGPLALDRILSRPAVRNALDVWREHRRLPKPSPPNWYPRPRVADRQGATAAGQPHTLSTKEA